MKHRILFVIEDLYPLGAAKQLFGLAKALVDRGDEIHVAVLGQREFEPDQWTETGIEVSFLNADDKTPLHTMRDSLQVVRELRRLIVKWKPGIVHTWCGVAELLGLIAAVNFPFVKRHERFRLISTELFNQPEKRFTRQYFEKKLSRRVERMIVPHESVKQHLVQNGYREPRIKVVPNSLVESGNNQRKSETARIALRERLGIAPDAFVAGTVARLEPRTRIKDLIWATDLLTVIRSDFHFVVIGTGSQRRRLKRFAALTESRTHVHVPGHIENPEEVIAGLDFYWHSHFVEPLPTNLMGAMAKGIPAISVYGTGTEEIVLPQETALAVNFGARDEFARWTKYLIEQTDSARKLTEQGQAFVKEQFPLQVMVDGYLGVYDLTD